IDHVINAFGLYFCRFRGTTTTDYGKVSRLDQAYDLCSPIGIAHFNVIVVFLWFRSIGHYLLLLKSSLVVSNRLRMSICFNIASSRRRSLSRSGIFCSSICLATSLRLIGDILMSWTSSEYIVNGRM